MMTKRLSDLADIYAGYLFANGVQPDPASPYFVLQLKDIKDAGNLNIPSIRVKIQSLPKTKYFLKKDDVIFSAKVRLQAIHIKQSLENVIISSQFFVIRPKTKLADSQYLSWFLNQSPAKKFLAKHTEGTNVLGVKLKNLSELPVIIMPEEKRNTLLILEELKLRRQTLTKELDNKINRLINLISSQLLATRSSKKCYLMQKYKVQS